MSTKNQYKKIVSPRGEALYPRLTTPDEYQGKVLGYTIQVKFSKEDTDKLIEALENELEKAKQSPEFKGKRWSKEPSMGYRETDDGDIIFKFKTTHEFTTKGGDVVKKTVAVFDAKGKPVPADIKNKIGNGSTVRISFQVLPFHMSNNNNGLSLRLEAVQLINLVEYGGGMDAGGYGFDEEDGYSADEEIVLDVSDIDDDSGDF